MLDQWPSLLVVSDWKMWTDCRREDAGRYPSCRPSVTLTHFQSGCPPTGDSCPLVATVETFQSQNVHFQKRKSQNEQAKKRKKKKKVQFLKPISKVKREDGQRWGLRTCCTQRVSFRDETATGVDHKLPSVRVVPSVHQFSCFTWKTQTGQQPVDALTKTGSLWKQDILKLGTIYVRVSKGGE